jgi:solute:Na+ symporter, SSS family
VHPVSSATHVTSANLINLAVVVGYLLMIVGVGTYFALRRKSASQFMLADQSMPGWAVGLSMFGSYISSISFLGNPATTFKGNWMFAGFTLMTPIGLLVGTRVFMKFYRRGGAVSAYSHLEKRFGPWARTYAVFTFLILQMARMGTILFLLSQAVLPLLGGTPNDVGRARLIIVAVGALITLYTLFGGIEAVVWTGVIQAFVLILGPILCVATLLWKMPGGLGRVIEIGASADKFSLGWNVFDVTIASFWLVVVNGLIEHLRNWGVDQSYIQRYLSATTEREASRSIWIAGLLYMPVAFFFFFMGTALFAFYQVAPDRLPAGIAPDAVFPHFITRELAVGLSGLVIAAIFAASMDSNLNSMATLTLVDGYKRYARPTAGDRESLYVLWTSTVLWGCASIGYALFMTLKGTTTTLQFAADVSGLLAGGLLGLFLLGLMSKRVTSGIAGFSVTVGVLLITWLTLSRLQLNGQPIWPAAWSRFRSPLHQMVAGAIGTVTIVVLGLLLAALRGGDPKPNSENREGASDGSTATAEPAPLAPSR